MWAKYGHILNEYMPITIAVTRLQWYVLVQIFNKDPHIRFSRQTLMLGLSTYNTEKYKSSTTFESNIEN